VGRRTTLLLLFVLVPLLLALARPAAADEVEALLSDLASPRERDRVHAALRLGEVAGADDRPRVTPVLVAALRDASAVVRQASASSLARIGDPRAVPGLLARLDEEPDESTLCAVLLALGAAKDAGSVERLAVVAKTHPLPAVRAAAVTALGDVGGEAARGHVLDVLRAPGVPDPDWALRSAAVLALVSCGHADDVGTVLVVYREEGGERHWFARSCLASLVGARDRDPLPILRRMVLDPDPRVAVTAAVGIAGTGHLQEMLVLLRHTSPTVRAAAASAVARAEVRGAYGRLRSMARFDGSARVRWAAALALFRLELPEGDEYVLAGLASREPVVWSEALAALVERTGERHGRDVGLWRRALQRWRAAR